MLTKSFKEWLRSSGPDTIKTPMLSREERLTKFMPPAVAEMLEQRRLLTLDTALTGGGASLEITGTGSAEMISVSVNPSDTSIYVTDGTNTYGPFGQNISLIKIWAGAGNDSVYINRGGSDSVTESCLIYGEAGNDLIEGGDLADSISATTATTR